MSKTRTSEQADLLSTAKRVLEMEAQGLELLQDALDQRFVDAAECIARVKGRTILAGVGKSGHVARKIAATLASTGTPAQFVHPTEASHGDLGMITTDDAVLALSRSGETRELADLVGYCRRFGIPLIAMTANPQSMLGRAADHILLLPDAPEACSATQAPTTSTTLQIAFGDALSIALLERRGFTASDFGAFHPGGSLGAALSKVEDLMHVGDQVPLVAHDALMSEAIVTMSAKGFGCVGVVSAEGRLIGIVTDGDLRRHMGPDLLQQIVSDVMTANPRTASPQDLAADALRRMTREAPQVTILFAVHDDRPVGLIHAHDCLRAGIS